jgi:ubiquinone/menaquinone biosynthesis C-methylase UbiE
MFGPDGPSLRELLVQGLDSTRGGYQRLAEKFDRTPFRTPDEIVAGLFARLPPAADGIDLCCGTGAVTAFLRRHCTGEVVGLDFSSNMLAVAARRVPDVRWVEADVRAVPAELDGRFDLVVSAGAFGHFRETEQPRLLDTVHRLLRPGGTFGFVTSTRPPPWSPTGWALRGFNAAMAVRNAVRRPEFVMDYLNFCWPEIAPKLEAAGLEADAIPLGSRGRCVVVVAKRLR